MIAGPELRLHLEPVRPVEHHVEYRAHVQHATVAAGHDVEQFEVGLAGRSLAADGDGYDHALEGKYDR